MGLTRRPVGRSAGSLVALLVLAVCCRCAPAAAKLSQQSGGAGHVAGEEHAHGGEAAALRHSGSAGGDRRLQGFTSGGADTEDHDHHKHGKPCPAGQYEATHGKWKNCLKCRGQTYTSHPGASRCKPCSGVVNKAHSKCKPAPPPTCTGVKNLTIACASPNDNSVCCINNLLTPVRVFTANTFPAPSFNQSAVYEVCKMAGYARGVNLGLAALNLTLTAGSTAQRDASLLSTTIAQAASVCLSCIPVGNGLATLVWDGSPDFQDPLIGASPAVLGLDRSLVPLGVEQGVIPSDFTLPVLCAECSFEGCYSCYIETGACARCLPGFVFNAAKKCVPSKMYVKGG